MRKGIALLPLHYGKAPPWLFNRMVVLSKSILELIVMEHGRDTLLERLSDPFWFQSLGCVLGFDWHSSGLTTTLCGAMKEALKDVGKDIGVFIAGGKGKIAINTPRELDGLGELTGIDVEPLKEVSRLSAKVDNTLLQDGYQLYHHVVIFTQEGRWAVVQQGMNEKKGYARRYHWLGSEVNDFTEEPHSGISAQKVHSKVLLNLTSKDSRDSKEAVLELVKEKDLLLSELDKLRKLEMPKRHYIKPSDVNLKRLKDTVAKLEGSLGSFEELLKMKGIGAKTLRALTLVSELVYGAEPSFKDPARYTFAHGGKDGHPFPVKVDIYDATIDTLKKAIEKTKIGHREKVEAIKKLSRILNH